MYFIKRVKPLGWVALLCTLIISTVIIFLVVGHSSHAGKLSNKATSIKTNFVHKDITVNTEMGEYPGLQLHTELKGLEDYTISINYPFTNLDTIDQPIETWVHNQTEDFLETIQSNETSGDQPFRSHLNIHVETNAITDNIYNIVLNAYHYMGGANGISFTKSFNFNVEEERHLTLEDIFIHPDNDSFNEKVMSEIHNIIAENDDYNEFIDDELLQDNMNSIKDWNWGITKEKFTMYFNEYEIGPGALGDVSFAIEMDQLDDYVQSDWLTTFEMDDEIAKRKQKEKERKAKEKAESQNNNSTPVETDGKYIALTFDDGPHPDVTPRILESLAQYDAKATFFMLGLQVEYYPELAAEVANQGHEVANHSHSHTDMTLLGNDQIAKEIATTNANIENITGSKSVLFRPPYGAYNEQVQNIAKQNGLSIILWSVDSLDWKNRNKHTIHSTVTANATVGSTVLLHDIHPTTADALPEVLKTLSEQGYEFITVSELMEKQGKSGIGPF